MRPLPQPPEFRYARTLDAKATRSFAHSVEAALFLVALLCLGYVAYVTVDRAAFESTEGARLARILSLGHLGKEPDAKLQVATQARASAAADGLIGRIEIPSVEVEAIVAAGVDPLTLRRAVGHLPATAFPGEAGNVALAAHRDTIFRGLKKLKLHDKILLSTPDGEFEYAVESMSIVTPQETRVLAAGDYPSLTLITCYPFNYVGPAPLRFVVRAKEVHRGVGSVGVEGGA